MYNCTSNRDGLSLIQSSISSGGRDGENLPAKMKTEKVYINWMAPLKSMPSFERRCV